MKLKENQLIALQNVLDCMEHYMLIDHVRDEYRESDWNDLNKQVGLLQKIVNQHLPVKTDHLSEYILHNMKDYNIQLGLTHEDIMRLLSGEISTV